MTKASNLFRQEEEHPSLIVTASEFYGSLEDEFIPLIEEENNPLPSDILSQQYIPQPAITPGRDTFIPSIQSFKNPGSSIASIFQKLYFQTDQFYPKDTNSSESLQKIAKYLKKHPNTYVFIEGHCDKRASESYNLALGTKRANKIRTMIIQYGANPNQLFTISYGKEKPISKGNSKSDFAKNRRVAFKIYKKESL